MKKLLFIYNPNAGKGGLSKVLSGVIETLSDGGFEVTVYPTKKQGDAKEKAFLEGNSYDFLLCSGGDGTLNEVVNGLMKLVKEGKELPKFGYLPSGTVNDFASSLGISKNPEDAVQIIVNGKDVFTDIGSFSEDGKEEVYFTYVAAFGAFTEVSYATSQDAKNLLGKAAYFLEGLKSLAKVRNYKIKISHDNEEIEDEFVFGMIANSKSVGGFKGITGPEVYLDDGEFDAIFVKNPKNPMDLQNIINSFLTMNVSSELIYHFHSKSVIVEAEDEDLQWTIDGEDGGCHNKVVLKNHKQAIEIRIPDKEIEAITEA